MGTLVLYSTEIPIFVNRREYSNRRTIVK